MVCISSLCLSSKFINFILLRLKSKSEEYVRINREPNISSVFLIRFIIQALCDGPLSEKEIKTLLTDVCRDIGIRSTGRGSIAGSFPLL